MLSKRCMTSIREDGNKNRSCFLAEQPPGLAGGTVRHRAEQQSRARQGWQQGHPSRRAPSFDLEILQCRLQALKWNWRLFAISLVLSRVTGGGWGAERGGSWFPGSQIRLILPHFEVMRAKLKPGARAGCLCKAGINPPLMVSSETTTQGCPPSSTRLKQIPPRTTGSPYGHHGYNGPHRHCTEQGEGCS